MSELAYIVTVRAQAGKSELLGAALGEMVNLTRQESGCGICELHRSSADAATWMIYERWRDKEAFAGHMQQPYTLKFVERLGDLASEPAEVREFLWHR